MKVSGFIGRNKQRIGFFNILDVGRNFFLESALHIFKFNISDHFIHSILKFGNTCWWSKWEVLSQVVDYFGYVEPFIHENEEI